MGTFICTVCQWRIKEHCSNVECGFYGDMRPMIEDTTKLYDKSFLCPHFIHVRERNKKVCREKTSYTYRYEALKFAAKRFIKNGNVLRPYKCKICHRWHLTSECSDGYDPQEAYLSARKKQRIYD